MKSVASVPVFLHKDPSFTRDGGGRLSLQTLRAEDDCYVRLSGADSGQQWSRTRSKTIIEQAYCPPGLVTACQGAKEWLQARMPIMRWLPSYSIEEYLVKDAMGGLTIGLVALAQTLAHAAIATTHSIQGPYCAFVPTYVYAIFGTSPHASVSSGAIAAILIADQLRPWESLDDRTELASLLAFISGCVLILMGWCKLAFAVRFLSHSTLSGFITGGAIIIMVQQTRNLFGFHNFPHTGSLPAHIVKTFEFIRDGKADAVSLAVGIFFICLLDGFNRLKARANAKLKKGPDPWSKAMKRMTEMKEIIVAVMGITFGYLTTFFSEDGSPLLTVVGHIPSGLPPFRPPWEIRTFEPLIKAPERLPQFILGGVLVAFTSFLTTYATTKKMALKFGYQLDPSQELIALGLAGVGGSFFGAFPPSGSLSRTGLAADVGIKTQMGGVFAASVIGLGLLFLAPALSYLPKAALAAVIMKSSVSLADFDTPRELWKHWKPKRKGGLKRDLKIWVIAFIVTLGFGVLYGIGLAVLVDIVLIVKDAAQPQAVQLGRDQGKMWLNVKERPGATTYDGILVFEFRGPLAFASAEWFQEAVERERAERDQVGKVEIVVISFTSVHYLDSTAMRMLKDLIGEWKKQGIGCVIAGAKHQVRILAEDNLKTIVDQTDFMMSISDAVDLAQRRLAGHKEHNLGSQRFTKADTQSEASQNGPRFGRTLSRTLGLRPRSRSDSVRSPNPTRLDVRKEVEELANNGVQQPRYQQWGRQTSAFT